ncbi:MAG: ribosomal-processing cysteine protease Prp [Aristaeellaceae bacterium]
MIQARINREKREIVVEGHAGAVKNSAGHDLVCCAASVLVQTLIFSARRAGFPVGWEIRDGYTRIDLGKAGEDDALCVMVDMLEDGMKMLQMAYPDCITVNA